MAGLEVVVRPLISPDIRPAPARRLPPEDDPEKGFCTIKGNPGTIVGVSRSYSLSISKSKGVETSRVVDTTRVHPMDADGNVNPDEYVDIDVAKRIDMNGGNQPLVDDSGPGSGTPGVGSGTPGVGSNTPKVGPITTEDYYTPARETDNIEIIKRDKTVKPEGGEGGGT